jgi:uncharacterized protein DUF6458
VGIGVSLFLLALGAILTFAVHVTARGIDVNTVGVILMLIGAVGLLATLIFWSESTPWSQSRRRRVVYEDGGDDVVVRNRPRTTVYRRDEVV